MVTLGCQSAQTLVDSTKQAGTNFKESAKNEITSNLPPGTMQQLESLKNKSAEAKAAVLQAESMLVLVLAGHGITVPQKAEVEKILKDGSVDARLAMQPVLEGVSKNTPAMRQWADNQIATQIKASEGPIKKSWEDLERRVAAFKNPEKPQPSRP